MPLLGRLDVASLLPLALIGARAGCGPGTCGLCWFFSGVLPGLACVSPPWGPPASHLALFPARLWMALALPCERPSALTLPWRCGFEHCFSVHAFARVGAQSLILRPSYFQISYLWWGISFSPVLIFSFCRFLISFFIFCSRIFFILSFVFR